MLRNIAASWWRDVEALDPRRATQIGGTRRQPALRRAPASVRYRTSRVLSANLFGRTRRPIALTLARYLRRSRPWCFVRRRIVPTAIRRDQRISLFGTPAVASIRA